MARRLHCSVAMASHSPSAHPIAPPAGRLPGLAQQDLWATLAWQVQDFTERSGLRCAASIDIDPGVCAPLGVRADAICGIFQEMLTNVARHAQATEVLLRVCARPGDLTLLVKDNGRGAPPSAFERFDAHGVAGMRACAGQHGGWLQIRSEPGQGTQLILSMPLDHAVRSAMPVAARPRPEKIA